MHGIFTIKGIKADSRSSLPLKVFTTYFSLSLVFTLLAFAASLVLLIPLGPILFKATLFKFSVLLTALLLVQTIALGLILKAALSPLNELIDWVDHADTLEPLEVPANTSREIRGIYLMFNSTLRRLKKAQRMEAAGEKDQALVQLATQLAHDIRSPLMALKISLNQMDSLPEEIRVLVRGAATRIQDIANVLLERYQHKENSGNVDGEPDPDSSVHLAAMLCESIISEKRAQIGERTDLKINFMAKADAYRWFIKVDSVEFKRVLSNLLNNSIEACHEGGKIKVELNEHGNGLEIKVSDTGCGMPKEIRERVLKQTLTHGKVGGYGMGLSHARNWVKAWGGQMEIYSQLGLGTDVIIRLPISTAPAWFVPSLNLSHRTEVIILDDDPNIHHTWRNLFNRSPKIDGLVVTHLYDEEQLENWLKTAKQPETDRLFLIDYELVGSNHNGLELINKHKLVKQAILVTSREEASLRRQCVQLAVPLIPKFSVRHIPISIKEAL